MRERRQREQVLTAALLQEKSTRLDLARICLGNKGRVASAQHCRRAHRPSDKGGSHFCAPPPEGTRAEKNTQMYFYSQCACAALRTSPGAPSNGAHFVARRVSHALLLHHGREAPWALLLPGLLRALLGGAAHPGRRAQRGGAVPPPRGGRAPRGGALPGARHCHAVPARQGRQQAGAALCGRRRAAPQERAPGRPRGGHAAQGAARGGH